VLQTSSHYCRYDHIKEEERRGDTDTLNRINWSGLIKENRKEEKKKNKIEEIIMLCLYYNNR
jgi:hypothetical protein